MKILLKKLKKNDDGIVAIEFGILIFPFLLVLFSIIEVSMLFFFTSTTERALAEVARDIRTGVFQGNGGDANDFKTAICGKMAMLSSDSCASNIRVDVVSTATGQFVDLRLPQFPVTCAPNDDVCEGTAPDPSAVPPEWVDTQGGDIVIVRIQYVYHLLMPSALNRLSTSPGNTRVITKTTAFKNEPFGNNT